MHFCPCTVCMQAVHMFHVKHGKMKNTVSADSAVKISVFYIPEIKRQKWAAVLPHCPFPTAVFYAAVCTAHVCA